MSSSFLPKCAMRAENGTAANRALDGGTHRGATQTSTRTTRPRTHAPRMPHAAPPHFPVSPLCTPRRALSGSRHPVSSISFFLLPVATLRHRSVLSRQPQAIRRRRPGHGGPSCGSSCEDAKGGTLPCNLRFHKGLVQYSVRNQPFFSLWDAYSTVSSLSQILAKNPSVHWFRTHNLMPQRACLNRSKCFS